MAGGQPGPNSLSVSGAPWAICITPRPTQFLYSADAVPGRIYKLTLDGKVLGVLGDAGKEIKQFGWIHEIACFFSSRRRHTRFYCDWSSDVCSSDLSLSGPKNIFVVLIGIRVRPLTIMGLGKARIPYRQIVPYSTKLDQTRPNSTSVAPPFQSAKIGRASGRERV